jgi:hypothetical protein
MNINTPDGKFAISGLRVFGKGTENKPAHLADFEVKRDELDSRIVKLSWKKIAGATGYNIRFGNKKDKLYQNYIVYDKTDITIRSLNKGQDYWFTVDVFSENGILKSNLIKHVD